MTEEQTQEEEKNVLAPGTDQDWTDETKGFTAGGKPKSDAKTDDKAKAVVEGKANEKDEDDEDEDDDADGELPKGIKKRVARANRQRDDAVARFAQLERKYSKLEEEIAALRTERTKPAIKAPAEEPDPDDYDTTADYEKAKRAWKAAQDKKKPEPKKEEPNTPALPPHIDAEEFETALDFMKTNLSDEVKADLSDGKKVPILTEDMLLGMYDIADGDKSKLELVTKFVIESPKVIKQIAGLPLRQQFAALEEAFGEYDAGQKKPKDDKEEKPKPEDKAAKKKADPDPPITRNKGNGAAKGAADADTFPDFENLRNEEERGKTGRAW